MGRPKKIEKQLEEVHAKCGALIQENQEQKKALDSVTNDREGWKSRWFEHKCESNFGEGFALAFVIMMIVGGLGIAASHDSGVLTATEETTSLLAEDFGTHICKQKNMDYGSYNPENKTIVCTKELPKVFMKIVIEDRLEDNN